MRLFVVGEEMRGTNSPSLFRAGMDQTSPPRETSTGLYENTGYLTDNETFRMVFKMPFCMSDVTFIFGAIKLFLPELVFLFLRSGVQAMGLIPTPCIFRGNGGKRLWGKANSF